MDTTAHATPTLPWSSALSVADDRMDHTHAASMDTGLALHLRSVGFDTATLANPDRVRPASMSGCGSVSCS